MTYQKPEIVAENKKEGSFAAACQPDYRELTQRCEACERTK